MTPLGRVWLRVHRAILTAVVLTLPGLACAQAPSGICQALVLLRNDLWLVRADGTPIRQLTTDGSFKYAAGISPDGKTIALSSDAVGGAVRLIDANGGVLADVDLKTTFINELRWVGPDLLRVREHVSPRASSFHFLHVPASGITPSSILTLGTGEGSGCALSSHERDMACAVADSVEVREKAIYYSPSPFGSASAVQDLQAGAGSTVLTTTAPILKIEVGQLADGTVPLKVTPPDGLSQSQFVRSGDTMPVTVTDESNSAALYGVSPSFKGDEPERVTLHIVKSNTGSFSLEGALAWDLRGKRLAEVESNDAGQQFLVIIDRERGEADEDHGGLRSLDGREPLSIAGPIRSIQFTSDTRIRVEGATQVFDQDIPAHGKLPAGAPFSITAALPSQLTVKTGNTTATATVEGWSCQGVGAGDSQYHRRFVVNR